MSINRTKQHMVEALADAENRVIALSGAWGTGKTHLWRELRETSADPAIKGSLYVSLFGLRDLNEVKVKLMQGVLSDSGSASAAMERIGTIFEKGIKVLNGFHSGFSALEGLPLLATPAMLKEKVIVLDDIERKRATLEIEEILGFIDEFTQQHGCRFVLVLNSDRLDQIEPWNLLREKVIDLELRLDTTLKETFEIAARLTPTAFGDRIEKALATCGVNNIRVARKVIRAVNKILSSRQGLSDAVLSRVVPSTVLLAALHYKGVEQGPEISFVLDLGTARDWSIDDSGDPANEERVARWTRLTGELGILRSDEYEALVVEYLESGLFDLGALSAIIDRYVDEEERMEAQNRARDFFDKELWNHRASHVDLIVEARGLYSIAPLLDPFTVSQLHETIERIDGGRDVAEAILKAWIDAFRRARPSGAGPDDFFVRELHPAIRNEFDAATARERGAMTVVDAVLHIAEHSGWNAREEAAMRAASESDFETAIRTMEIPQLKIFMRRMMDMVGQPATYESHFPGAVDKFIVACRRIAHDPNAKRLASLIGVLFKAAKIEGKLA